MSGGTSAKSKKEKQSPIVYWFGLWLGLVLDLDCDKSNKIKPDKGSTWRKVWWLSLTGWIPSIASTRVSSPSRKWGVDMRTGTPWHPCSEMIPSLQWEQPVRSHLSSPSTLTAQSLAINHSLKWFFRGILKQKGLKKYESWMTGNYINLHEKHIFGKKLSLRGIGWGFLLWKILKLFILGF